jgi:hypothetical protein
MEDAGQKAVSGPGNIDREGPPRREPRFWVREAAFSPDNKSLFTAYSSDGRDEDRHVFPKTASLWDVTSGKECWSLRAGEFSVNPGDGARATSTRLGGWGSADYLHHTGITAGR